MPDSAPSTSSAAVPLAPTKKQAIAFFDGQNLFHTAQEAFGIREPNFDPIKLAEYVCALKGWGLKQVRLYTGVPGLKQQPKWNRYWVAKLRRLRNLKVEVFSPELRYREKEAELPLTADSARWARFILPDGTPAPRGPILDCEGRELPAGTTLKVMLPEEKGVDVRLAVDFIRLTLDRAFDAAILFTQDQDHAETVKEAKRIARDQGRENDFPICSAYPDRAKNPAGVNGTEFLRIPEADYRECIDPRDYFRG